MELPYLKFIYEANKSFTEFKHSYSALTNAVTSGDTALFAELKSDWYSVDGDLNSPLKLFIDSLIDFEETNSLPNEIEKCLLNNHLGAIEYTRLFFVNQYPFINREEVDYYINNIIDSNDLFTELYDNENQLSHSDFLKALKIQYIQCILEFEYEFKKAYPFFEPRFLNSEYEKLKIKIKDGIGNNIRLDYSDEKKAVIIREIHDVLYGPYIDVELDEFSNHFRPFAAKTKMRWSGSQTQLVLLFRGKRIVNTRRKNKINFRNQSIIQLICEHFCQEDNNNWDRNKLKKTQDKVDDPYLLHEDVSDMEKLFSTIEELTA